MAIAVGVMAAVAAVATTITTTATTPENFATMLAFIVTVIIMRIVDFIFVVVERSRSNSKNSSGCSTLAATASCHHYLRLEMALRPSPLRLAAGSDSGQSGEHFAGTGSSRR